MIEYVLYAWITTQLIGHGGVAFNAEYIVKARFKTMDACRSALAEAETNYAIQPDVPARFACIKVTEEDRDAERKRIADHMDRLAELCARSQDPIICDIARKPPPKHFIPGPRFTNPYAKRSAD